MGRKKKLVWNDFASQSEFELAKLEEELEKAEKEVADLKEERKKLIEKIQKQKFDEFTNFLESNNLTLSQAAEIIKNYSASENKTESNELISEESKNENSNE